MKTENLAIILTDIVGYTEATSRLSRKEQKEMLNLHNQLLFPIIRNFGGKVVKTIGDALLLVFNSPTDAMLCSMAMQDALYDFNRKSESSQELHIRIAASLGEVRVARNDVFGEAVNLTSRIESITPEDEIYLSEAIYLAMNKAEVPCVEVGLKQLKGISEPVRIWQIPRFSRNRLVPEEVNEEDIGELSYPYGGAHLVLENRQSQQVSSGAKKMLLALFLVLLAGAAGAYFYLNPVQFKTAEKEPAPVAEPSKVVEKKSAVKPAAKPAAVKPAPKPAPKVVASKPAPAPKVESKPVAREVASELPAKNYDSLIRQLSSNNGNAMRLAARRVYDQKIFVPEVLSVIDKQLLDNYQNKRLDKVKVDALAWYCRVLAQANNKEYLPTLVTVSKEARNDKLKKYAARSRDILLKASR